MNYTKHQIICTSTHVVSSYWAKSEERKEAICWNEYFPSEKLFPKKLLKISLIFNSLILIKLSEKEMQIPKLKTSTIHTPHFRYDALYTVYCRALLKIQFQKLQPKLNYFPDFKKEVLAILLKRYLKICRL